MKILEMMMPRLALMVELAGDREVVRDDARLGQLREDYRYMAAVCRSILPHLESDLVDLPPELGVDADISARVSFQMALVKRTNRLHRAVAAYLSTRLEAGEAEASNR